ncbi:TPA: hypothetical protein N0F65_008932 [Lagenidium giganteum]|uniref:DUF1279 domain-containing protein n=1 Tax=Lagenidium giganteum TaxID=4803 RepID=A0AAV2YYJ9_9STRA|nr:TPA: hypothetical protein N0F65_008932 [Lagenidium giganteum]
MSKKQSVKDKKQLASVSGTSWLPRALIGAIAALGVAVAYLLPTEADRLPRPTAAALFPRELHEISRYGDRVFSAEHQTYAFGRWKKPLEQVEFHVDADWKLKLQTLFQTKYWHYQSVNTKDFFIGSAIVKLGYANDAFLYVVDKTSPEMEKFEWQGRLPGDLGLSFASSSIDKSVCTSFKSLSPDFVSFCYDSERRGWSVKANVTTIGVIHGEAKQLQADVFMRQEEALMVLFPNGNDTMRPAYVHKGAGSLASGSFSFGNVSVDLQTRRGLAGIDWTRSMTLRCTRWKWASSSFRALVTTTVQGKTPVTEEANVGINFSKDVYDIDGESQENAIWVNGQVYVMRGVNFAIPETEPLKNQWKVSTMPDVKEESVQLTFTPRGSREDHTKLLLVESDFIQPYGVFDGSIAFTTPEGTKVEIAVKQAFGVVENHFALPISRVKMLAAQRLMLGSVGQRQARSALLCTVSRARAPFLGNGALAPSFSQRSLIAAKQPIVATRHLVPLQRHPVPLVRFSVWNTRHCATSSSSSSVSKAVTEQNMTHWERLKDLWRKYGVVAIGTYFTMYGVVLGSIYVAIEKGWVSTARVSRSDGENASQEFNVVTATNKFVTLAEDLGIAKHLDVQRVGPKTGSFLIAWIVTKFTEPLRLALTLAITPRISRLIRRAPKL